MKHVVTLTTSNPSHEHVSLRRRQSTTNFMVEAADEDQAIFRATAHFRKLGHYIHEAKIFKKKDQLNENLLRVITAAPKLLKFADDAIDAAKQIATRTKQVGTHNKETNLGSVVPGTISTKGKELVVVKTAPAPVKTLPTQPAPVRTLPAPVKTIPTQPAPTKTLPAPAKTVPTEPVPTKTSPVPAKTSPAPTTTTATKPMNPLAAAATVALGTLALRDQLKQKFGTQPQTDVAVKPEVQTQTQTQMGGNEPPPPTSTETKPSGRIVPFIPFGLRLGNRGEEDIGTLGQYRGMAPMYQHYQFNEESKALNAIGRVISKRKEMKKDDAESEKNKINMEPKLKTK